MFNQKRYEKLNNMQLGVTEEIHNEISELRWAKNRFLKCISDEQAEKYMLIIRNGYYGVME